MHSLKRYLESVGEPITDFAARVGASRQTLYRIISGAQAPKPALARRIVEATGGAVSIESLYQDIPNNARSVKGSVGDVLELEASRLRIAIAAVYKHFAPTGAERAPDALIASAVQATIGVCDALSVISDRVAAERLSQALRPVLQEVLNDYENLVSSHTLERAVNLGVELYFGASRNQLKQERLE